MSYSIGISSRLYVREELFRCVGLPDGKEESAAFRIDADDTNAPTIADLGRIGHRGQAMRDKLAVVAAAVNDRSSSKFKAPLTVLVLIAVITFVLFMLIAGECALSALSADLKGQDDAAHDAGVGGQAHRAIG